jgi:small-conductance mechanosensitive channel
VIPPIVVLIVAIAASAVILVLLARWLETRLPKTWSEPGAAVLQAVRGPLVVLLALAGVAVAPQLLDVDAQLTGSIQQAVVALAIVAVAWFAAALARRLAMIVLARSAALPNATLFGNLAWGTAIVLGALIAMGTLGLSITPLLTALGVGGLAVALALQPTLTNLFAGVQVLASGQVRPGDYIRLSTGEEGYVTDVTWRLTSIRALSNNLIIVPNAQLASAVLTNYHLPENEMSVLVQVGVAYDSDLASVERVTLEVAREVMKHVEGGVPTFEPLVRYHTFGDSSIDFTVVLRAREYVDQYLIKHEFIKRLQVRYRDEGIVIPFPIRTVVLEGGAPVARPTDRNATS